MHMEQKSRSPTAFVSVNHSRRNMPSYYLLLLYNMAGRDPVPE